MSTDPLPRRALQKQARRDVLVAAAETLIRHRGDTNFSMLDLAKLADLSPATPYNLFGGKSAILYALLNRSADNIFMAATALPGAGSDRVVHAAKALAEVLAGDPEFYRPLYAYLMGVADTSWRPAFMARTHKYWVSASSAPMTFMVTVPLPIVADLLVTQALGCVELWVHGDIGDDDLSIELCRAAAIVLSGLLDQSERKKLLPLIAARRSLKTSAVSDSSERDHVGALGAAVLCTMDDRMSSKLAPMH